MTEFVSSFPVWLFKLAARETRPKFDATKETNSVMETILERIQSHKESKSSDSIESELSHTIEGEPNHSILINAVPTAFETLGYVPTNNSTPDVYTMQTPELMSLESPSMGSFIDALDASIQTDWNNWNRIIPEEDSVELSSSLESQETSQFSDGEEFHDVSLTQNETSTMGSPDILYAKFHKRDTFVALLSDIELLNTPGLVEVESKVSNLFDLRDLILKKKHKFPFFANYALVFIGVVWILTYFILTLAYAMQFSREPPYALAEEHLHWLINLEAVGLSMPSSWGKTERWLLSTLLSVLESILVLSPIVMFLKTLFRLFLWIPFVELITHCLPICCCIRCS